MNIKETEKHLKNNINELEKTIVQYDSFFETNKDFMSYLNNKYNIPDKSILEIKNKAVDIVKSINKLKDSSKVDFFHELRMFLLNDYGVFLGLLKMLFYQIIFYTNKQNIIDLISSSDDPAFNFIGGNYLLLTVKFKMMKTIINQYFFKDITLKDELIVNDNTELWSIDNMTYKLFPSDFNKIREYTLKVLGDSKDKLPPDDWMVLNQQVSELMKNAIKHGNKCDQKRLVKVWYEFDPEFYKIIVEDQGEGFQQLKEWNDFNCKRNEAIRIQDMEKMAKYIAFKSDSSDENDGGNALFAALEYWDSGIIFNSKKNKVVAFKYF